MALVSEPPEADALEPPLPLLEDMDLLPPVLLLPALLPPALPAPPELLDGLVAAAPPLPPPAELPALPPEDDWAMAKPMLSAAARAMRVLFM
jgi:hypothetical protein